MINQSQEYRRLFAYKDGAGNPIVGATGLTPYVRVAGSGFVVASNAITEPSSGIAPGFYEMLLTSTETSGEWVQWVVKDGGGVVVDCGSESTHASPYDAIFTEPADPTLRDAFLNRIADHVLRRSVGEVEAGTVGDDVNKLSLLGAILLQLNGQQIMGPDTNGNYWIPINSSKPGLNPIGFVPLSVSGGKITGTLPFGVAGAPSDLCDPCS